MRTWTAVSSATNQRPQHLIGVTVIDLNQFKPVPGRLADAAFKQQLQEARQCLRESILAKLSDAGHDAVGTLWELMQTAEDEGVRLRAAKAVLDRMRGFKAEGASMENNTRMQVERTQSVIEGV